MRYNAIQCNAMQCNTITLLVPERNYIIEKQKQVFTEMRYSTRCNNLKVSLDS